MAETEKNNEKVVLQVENLTAGYGKRVVLRGFNFELREGEVVVVVVGPNGAGKSTFFRAVVGLAHVFEGTIKLRVEEGFRDITFLPVFERIRLGLGFMMQDANIFPGLSVEENLFLAVGDLKNQGDAVEEVLKIFPELREMKQIRAGLLSRGWRQILALSMVLARKPRVLLLDEPTAGVGREFVTRIRKVLLDHWHTGVMATHAGVEFWEKEKKAKVVRLEPADADYLPGAWGVGSSRRSFFSSIMRIGRGVFQGHSLTVPLCGRMRQLTKRLIKHKICSQEQKEDEV